MISPKEKIIMERIHMGNVIEDINPNNPKINKKDPDINQGIKCLYFIFELVIF